MNFYLFGNKKKTNTKTDNNRTVGFVIDWAKIVERLEKENMEKLTGKRPEARMA